MHHSGLIKSSTIESPTPRLGSSIELYDVMPTQMERYTCRDIHSTAAVETLDSYKDNLEFYRNPNFTFVPMPVDGKYFDLRTNEFESLADDQFIDVTASP